MTISRPLLIIYIAAMFAFSSVLPSEAGRKVRLRVVATSDIHGNYLPFDFVNNKPANGGMSRVATFIKSEREALGEESVILLDAGDILQGQPTSYYYNFIDTLSTHFCAAAMNYLQYDAATIGNHDIETGHSVYDRWTQQCNHPLICANAIDTRTGDTYWKPYTILERHGLRIAVLGMITPTIPQWLPRTSWANISFQDMVKTARLWIPVLKDKEHADVVIGLFHSGSGSISDETPMLENASLAVARQVPGFNLVICGHDHRAAHYKIRNTVGDSVVVLNPGANGMNVAVADIIVNQKGDVETNGSISDISNLLPQTGFINHFVSHFRDVSNFTKLSVGQCAEPISTRQSYFGPSAFVDFIHRMQLDLTGADISFAAPLSFDATLKAGSVSMGDLFTLYPYENRLYTMLLTGKEIHNYLEYSYNGWVRTMRNENDTMLLFRDNPTQYADGWQRLATPSYNFDSAAGLLYTVDLRRGKGKRISIYSLANRKAFHPDSTYKVAVNSYRGNGGGHLLTEGAGIPHEELQRRIVWSAERDLRYYFMQTIKQQGTIKPVPLNNWSFIPEEWVRKAAKREEAILFN